jgi:hypothetical protein
MRTPNATSVPVTPPLTRADRPVTTSMFHRCRAKESPEDNPQVSAASDRITSHYFNSARYRVQLPPENGG